MKEQKQKRICRKLSQGESQARNKYTYFVSVAKKAGYEQIPLCF